MTNHYLSFGPFFVSLADTCVRVCVFSVKRNIMPIEWESMNSLSMHFMQFWYYYGHCVQLHTVSSVHTVHRPHTNVNADCNSNVKCIEHTLAEPRPLQIKKQIEPTAKKRMLKSRWTIWPGTQVSQSSHTLWLVYTQ